jgi:hypothetical protein
MGFLRSLDYGLEASTTPLALSWEPPFTLKLVIPAKAGIHENGISRIEFPDFSHILKLQCSWIPAFAGMTG